MKMKKRIATILLAMLLLLQTTACSENSENTEKSNVSESTEETNISDVNLVETEPEDNLAAVSASFADRDYGGYNFRILDRGFGVSKGGVSWDTADVYAESMTGEVINDAVFERNNILDEKLKVIVVEQRELNPTERMKTSVAAQSDDFDVVTDSLGRLAATVLSGEILDYKDIPEVKMDQQWWDQQIISDMSVGNKVYFMTGDISIMDNYGTWCVMFNKGLVNDNGLDNPYDLVNEGTWTVDRLSEMAITATKDIDGNGKWDQNDQYGFVSEDYNTFGLYNCFGEKIAVKDENDIPVFAYNTERSMNALIKSLEVQYSESCNVKLYGGLSREVKFQSGGGLFYFAGMINVTHLRDSETDFGVIPAPKYDETQEQYYSTYSTDNMTAYSIPVTVIDTARVGDILEAMAALSTYTLTPAYYEKTLMGKSVRDEESKPMIELILNSRNFDLGAIFNWGSIVSNIRTLKDPNTVASFFKSYEKSASKILERFITNMNLQ